MSFDREKVSLIHWAKQLSYKNLITASSGNISLQVEHNLILISGQNTYLGHLNERDLVLVDFDGKVLEGEKRPSSELAMHLAAHKKFPEFKAFIHAHPGFATAYFNYFGKLENYSFENDFYLGDIPVLPQDTLNVSDVDSLVKALELNNVVVLKNHGAAAMGKSLRQAFGLLEMLEDQAKVSWQVRQTFGAKKEKLEKQIKAKGKTVELFSLAYFKKIKELLNKSREIKALVKKFELKGRIGFQFRGTNTGAAITFAKDKISLDNNPLGDLVIVGDGEQFQKVFSGELSLFTACVQGKLEMKPDFPMLAKWYPLLKEVLNLCRSVNLK